MGLMVKEAKGGTFSPSDIPIIRRALHTYLVDIQRIEGYGDREPHPDLNAVALLLHRLSRIEG